MPSITNRQAIRKSDSETIFTVVFCCIAGLIVFGCTLWLSTVLGAWKSCLRSSSDKRRGATSSKHVNRHQLTPKISFLKLATSPSSEIVPRQCLSLYDPRYETPFTQSCVGGVDVSTSKFSFRAASAPTTVLQTPGSDGLFTPVKYTDMSRGSLSFHSSRVRSLKTLSVSDSADARNFSLAIPEPLVLSDRPAGRPSAVTKHLSEYGRRNTLSTALLNRDVHPNKLLSTALNQNVHNSVCSSTSMKIIQESTNAVCLGAEGLTRLVEDALQEESHRQYPYSDSTSSLELTPEADEPATNQSLMAINRLRSYRSLTGSQMPKLRRSGTLTRPKTPVEEMKKRWDTQSSRSDIATTTQNMSLTTSVTTVDTPSDRASTTTPPATPLTLESPFEVQTAPLHYGIVSQGAEKAYSRALDVPKFTCEPVPISRSASASTQQASAICQTTRKPRPPPLKLQLPSGLDLSHQPTAARSATYADISSHNAPRTARIGVNLRASSMYSRDTYGFSIVRTPITPAFPSPSMSSMKESTALTTRHNAPGSVKERISHWTQRIEGLTTPTSITCDKSVVGSTANSAANSCIQPIACDANSTVKPIPTLYNMVLDGVEAWNQPESMHSEADSAPGGAKWI